MIKFTVLMFNIKKKKKKKKKKKEFWMEGKCSPLCSA